MNFIFSIAISFFFFQMIFFGEEKKEVKIKPSYTSECVNVKGWKIDENLQV